MGTFSFIAQENKTEVKQLIVLPEYKGKGYGKEIIQYMLSIMKIERVWLVTHPKNKRALLLYLKSGFEINGYKEDYYGDGQPRVVLTLQKK